MTAVPVTEARAHFAELVERSAAGERITLTSHGQAKAMLVPPHEDSRPRGFTRDQVMDILNHQLPPSTWDDIRFPGDTIGEDGLG